jgi:uncharacterized protein with HEPN domain
VTIPSTLAEKATHILSAINDFETCLSDAILEALRAEMFQRLAVERSFEIICGALSLLPYGVKTQQSQVDWQGMASLENRLRYHYYCDNTDTLLQIAARNLPPLKALVKRVIRESE